MSGWIETFTNLLHNPFFLILAVIIAVLIVWGVIKRLFKLAMIVLTAFVIYSAFLLWTGRSIPKSFDEIKESVKETVSSSKENVKENKEDIEEAVKEKAKKTFMDKLEDFFSGD